MIAWQGSVSVPVGYSRAESMQAVKQTIDAIDCLLARDDIDDQLREQLFANVSHLAEQYDGASQ